MESRRVYKKRSYLNLLPPHLVLPGSENLPPVGDDRYIPSLMDGLKSKFFEIFKNLEWESLTRYLPSLLCLIRLFTPYLRNINTFTIEGITSVLSILYIKGQSSIIITYVSIV